MKTAGAFQTTASKDRLHSTFASPAELAQVPTLRDVVRTDPQTVSMVFAPMIGLGPIPFRTRIVTTSLEPTRVALVVHAVHSAHVVDVAMVLMLDESGETMTASWEADVTVRGAAASVGQRVVHDLATRSIGDLLRRIAQRAEVVASAGAVDR